MESLIIENVRKIAILRANGLGDFIVTLPALNSLKIAYPEAEIILLAKEWHAAFLEDNRSVVDRVIVIPVSDGIREEFGQKEDPEELLVFFKEMQKEHFDIVINFHGKGIAANPFINKLGSRYTVGFQCVETELLDRAIPYYYYQSEVIRYLEICSLVGATTKNLEPEIHVIEKDFEEIEMYFNTGISKKYVAICPGAMDIRRVWPLKKFAQLANVLVQKKYEVVFTGDISDASLINTIIDQMDYPAINSAGQLSLSGLTGLFAKAHLVIGNDSGPLHLARSIGTKTVGIYWAPNLINWGPLTRANHHPVISWNLRCPQCKIIPINPYPFKPEMYGCSHAVSFVKDITVDEVMEQAMHLLNDKENIEMKTIELAIEPNYIDKQTVVKTAWPSL